jgi:aspartate ammonia-lyase
VLGYEKSAAIAKEALVTNRSVYELVLEKNLLTKTQLDDILKPENMTHPRQLNVTRIEALQERINQNSNGRL